MAASRHIRRVRGRAAGALAVAVLLGLVCAVALTSAGGAGAAAPGASAADARGLDQGAAARAPSGSSSRVGDWQHVLQVVAWQRRQASSLPLVYYFGASAARESVISDEAWSTDLSAMLHIPVVAWVTASGCQSFADDLRVVEQLPEGHALALITVGIGRFTVTHEPRDVPSNTTRSSPPGEWFQHHYDNRELLSAARKRSLARIWLAERGPVFARRFPRRVEELESLITTCLDHGFTVALVEMPTNHQVLGASYDEVRSRYQAGCAALAAEYGLDYVRFCTKIGLNSDDYHDLSHLLPSGRAKWQARLSQEIVARGLLEPLPVDAP